VRGMQRKVGPQPSPLVVLASQWIINLWEVATVHQAKEVRRMILCAEPGGRIKRKSKPARACAPRPSLNWDLDTSCLPDQFHRFPLAANTGIGWPVFRPWDAGVDNRVHSLAGTTTTAQTFSLKITKRTPRVNPSWRMGLDSFWANHSVTQE
jgi:hypothetical protein